jgi:hypothetical protein
MQWQGYWKAILAFVSTVVLPGVVMWVQSGQPWPTNAAAWVLWAVTVFGTTGSVAAGPANKTAGKHEAPNSA